MLVFCRAVACLNVCDAILLPKCQPANDKVNLINTKSDNFFLLLKRLWHHLTKRRRYQLTLLLGMMVVSAFAEVVSLGAVLPFLGVLIAPEKLFQQPAIASVAKFFGIGSATDLVPLLTAIFILAVLIAATIRLLVLWASIKLSHSAGLDLSIEVYRRTLYQPYRVHIARNSSEVISGIVNKVSDNITVLNQCLTLISSMLLLGAIILALLAINTTIACVAAVGFGVAYGTISWLSRNKLKINSQHIAKEQTQLLKALQEGLGGIRDVLLDGTQLLYCNIYRRANLAVRQAQSNTAFIAGAPRFAMEAFGMILIALLAYGISRQEGGIATGLPVMGALALGAQRMLPALQQSYAAWSNIAGSQASISGLLELLDQPIPVGALQANPAPLDFRETIRFEAVNFRYGDNGPLVLDEINLTIKKGTRVGFVGSTGSGKSTMMDLLMGLLEPTKGCIIVDGISINTDNRRAWQQAITHVPQVIYLADTTLAENIAFGIQPETIDMERVQQAAQQAQLADFIESQPAGYNAFVGERGVRLSGGQRQRIGIARALYKQASVLVFDEATSALDNTTEQAVMDAIENLNRDLTILLIAHRLTTVRRCDVIIELEHGRVVAQGTYEQLLECSPSFRSMAQALA